MKPDPTNQPDTDASGPDPNASGPEPDVSGPEPDVSGRDLVPVQFESEWDLPPGEPSALRDAQSAVAQEFADCSKWKRLQCRKVSVFAEHRRGAVHVIHVGSSVEFDWTWEGAVAFKPQSLDDDSYSEFSNDDYRLEGESAQPRWDDEVIWSGEIVEVDEQNGCLFVSLANPAMRPTTGAFFVRPFEFLGVLDSVYNAPRFAEIRRQLPGRLAASAGNVHPPLSIPKPVGQPQLASWWQHAWNVLWGPPGTGKTYLTGQQIAAAVADSDERFLVVSTTNRATDSVALAIGNATRMTCPDRLQAKQLLRIGKGASYQTFVAENLIEMLPGTDSSLLIEMDSLAQQIPEADSWEDRALTRKRMNELRSQNNDNSPQLFVDPGVQVVVATAFKTLSLLNLDRIRKMVESGAAPFTTIFIDEAGLLSRAAIAALSLLASRRVVLVGDSKQLAPISKISRILPTAQQTWLASSGLSHLDDISTTPPAVHVLSEQRRMHPEICRVVSDYQYNSVLQTAPETIERTGALPERLADQPRAIWYVLDEEGSDLSAVRAERGPGNRSWVRPATFGVLEKLFADGTLGNWPGLFISPYRAQAKAVADWFGARRMKCWESSTVHSQQGTESEIVIFDTVNAGSYNWPFDEWKRLVNVAISRARECVIVLASRSEMDEPYLRPLVQRLAPRVLTKEKGQYEWASVSPQLEPPSDAGSNECREHSLGYQIVQRKSLRPILSREQQQLSNLRLDGKPRLVRGVAGSGKSVVLANWLARTVKRLGTQDSFRVWAVYGNRSLHKLLQRSIELAWRNENPLLPFPWACVELFHIQDVLSRLLPSVELSMVTFQFDYDEAAKQFLALQDNQALLPRCSAMFIDEAQDMGPSTLRLLLSLVERTDPDDENSRSAHIFYDNAQNIYGRRTPRWSDFGIDMRGRSAIMKESFRSNRPISELAVNVLHQLTGPKLSPDQRELLNLGLVESETRNGQEWLRVRFNQVEGSKPEFHKFDFLEDEIDAIGSYLEHLIANEDVSPSDICLIYNGQLAQERLLTQLKPRLASLDVELSRQTSQNFDRRESTILLTTSHSFKGYDSEVVIIPCVDQYVAGNDQILARNLYVAMTRARSMLAMFALNRSDRAAKRLNDTIETCLATLQSTPVVQLSSQQDDFVDVLDLIGAQHRRWLLQIWRVSKVVQEPIVDRDGTLIAEPAFWFDHNGQTIACFTTLPEQDVIDRLESVGVNVCQPGEAV